MLLLFHINHWENTGYCIRHFTGTHSHKFGIQLEPPEAQIVLGLQLQTLGLVIVLHVQNRIGLWYFLNPNVTKLIREKEVLRQSYNAESQYNYCKFHGKDKYTIYHIYHLTNYHYYLFPPFSQTAD